MHIIAMAWAFVVVMMAAAEATASNGSLIGALFILLGYGVLPLSILLYILGTPMRRRARQAEATQGSETPDGGRVATRHPVPPEREEA